jgi:hypothetical protein
VPDDSLTPEQSQLLAAAIVEAMAAGNRGAADKLAALAKTPWKIDEVLATDGSPERPTEDVTP